MPALTIKAPAKINLDLKVKDLRKDGYHEIESIFLALDFGDVLHFETGDTDWETELTVNPMPEILENGKNPMENLPLSENLVFKAVSLFRKHTGFKNSLKISLEKHIPLGSGLGGGSSDAASTLLALNSLAETIPGIKPLDAVSLAELGAVLGSDVLFFLKKCRAARVSGRGEQIQPIEIPSDMWFVLVKPDFSIDTAEAYCKLDEFRIKNPNHLLTQRHKGAKGRIKDDINYPSNNNTCYLLPATCYLPNSNPRTPEPQTPYQNDFLPVFLADEKYGSVYSKILKDLQNQGAEYAGLSGTGSTCFGIFREKEKALKTYEYLKKDWFFVIFSFLLEI